MVEESVPQGSHEVSTTLNGDRFGAFGAIGAKVTQQVSGEEPRSFAESRQARTELENDMAQLIEAGDIKRPAPPKTPPRSICSRPTASPTKAWSAGWAAKPPSSPPSSAARVGVAGEAR